MKKGDVGMAKVNTFLKSTETSQLPAIRESYVKMPISA